MYPNLYYAVKDWFGIDVNAFKIFYTFGIFVALAFIIAAWVLSSELKRKEKQGLLYPREEVITVGKPVTLFELLINGLIGFIFGFKIIGAFIASRTEGVDLQQYIFSAEGSWFGGIAIGALLVFFKYREKNKQKLSKPEQRVLRIWPHDRIGDIVIFALIFGILGAKLFDNLENWDRFIKAPFSSLLSPSGLTFYGGLICAALAISFYIRRKGINFWHMADAVAPALMIAYAVGRIGCQVAGDGDWGVYNSAYISEIPGTVREAKPGEFEKQLDKNAIYFLQGRVADHDTVSSMVSDRLYDKTDLVPHRSFKAPSFLPNWMFAYTYPHNVNEDGVLLPDCEGKYCRALPLPVFPTPFYELIACTILFFVLWGIRKGIRIPGMIFAIYLFLNGFERFFIEKIRVNTVYTFWGIHPTQAQIISLALVISGLILMLVLRIKSGQQKVSINK